MDENDFDFIAEIEAVKFSDHLCRNGFKNALKQNNIFGYVYLEGRRILAYFILCVDGFIIHINSIKVHPNYRRKGVALECLKFVERFADNKKCTRVHLEVQERNLAAQLLFKKAGYKATRILRNRFSATNEDGYMMVRHLVEAFESAR